MPEISQLELALIDKRKAEIDAAIRPLLQEINQAIPAFTGKNSYAARITDIIFVEMFVDTQFIASVLNEQTLALFEAICTDLSPARRAELGLESLCE